jgi:hypothetical protein
MTVGSGVRKTGDRPHKVPKFAHWLSAAGANHPIAGVRF